MTQELETIPGRELLVLKAHMLLESALIRVLAARLGREPHTLPSLAFANLADLALRADTLFESLVPAVKALADMRNAYAHRWAVPDEELLMSAVVEAVPDLELPTGTHSSEASFRAALRWLLASVNGAVVLAHTDWAAFEEELKADIRERMQKAHNVE